MKTRSIVIVVLVVGFFIAVGAMLLREIKREEEMLAKSISGRAEVSSALYAAKVVEIRREDRAALMLIDPKTRQPVAMRMMSPFIPPATFEIGQEYANDVLEGAYYLLIITDKDGEIYRPSPGEIYGISKEPISLGSRELVFTVDQPFRGGLLNEGATSAPMMTNTAGEASQPAKEHSIHGKITVSKALAGNIESTDRIIILLFDPKTNRPVANKIIPHVLLPQAFSIGVPASVAKSNGGTGYFLRVVTDKNNNPFGSAPGEVVGRSNKPIPLGTKDVELEMDQEYKR